MTQDNVNKTDPELGFEVPNWTPPPRPDNTILEGQYCRLEPLDIQRHSAGLFAANQLDQEDRIWRYLPYGPFEDLSAYQQWMSESCFNGDPAFYAIIDHQSGKPTGVASYLRIDPDNGSIEVGHINYSPVLQRTIASTETMYLMMRNAFELGYRRYEWKCNSLNAKSCAAAERLGFSYEGIFRQAAVPKGRNRDTAWFACIDKEWPALDDAFSQWLDRDNFDSNGNQKTSLSSLTRPILVKTQS